MVQWSTIVIKSIFATSIVASGLAHATKHCVTGLTLPLVDANFSFTVSLACPELQGKEMIKVSEDLTYGELMSRLQSSRNFVEWMVYRHASTIDQDRVAKDSLKTLTQRPQS